MQTRRHFLSLSLLTAAGAALAPFAGPLASAVPHCLASLEDRLRGISRWVRPATGIDGVAEYHCGMADAPAWGRAISLHAGTEIKIKASGNILSATVAGTPVRLVMHTSALQA